MKSNPLVGEGPFLLHLYLDVDGMLESLGLAPDARVHLVVLPDDRSARLELIHTRSEPESPSLCELEFASVVERAEMLEHEFRDDPLMRRVMSGSTKASWDEEISGRAVARSIQEALDAAPDADVRWRRCSHFFRQGDWLLGVVADIDQAALSASDTYSLPTPNESGERLSLVRTAIPFLLNNAAMRLSRSRPLDPESGAWHQEILREAAVDLLSQGGVVHAGFHLFDALTMVAALSYEGSATNGSVLFRQSIGMGEGQPDAIPLDPAVDVADHAALRKLLAASTHARPLLTDGECIHGICCRRRENGGGLVTFRGAAQWEFTLSGQALFRVQGGLVLLPVDTRLREVLAARYEAAFGHSTEDEMQHVLSLGDAVRRTGKGAVLVISEDAAREASRLRESSFPTRPVRLDSEDVNALVRMDGAILVDRGGQLHAAGVILDGTHVGGGSRSRGARLNATRRYVQSCDEGRRCIALVVSEDGPYDVIGGERKH